MGKIYYKKSNNINKKRVLRFISFLLFLSGIAIIIYVFLPYFSWQIYFAPVFANQSIASPIPKNNIVSLSTFKSLLSVTTNSFSGVDYTNAKNWFPNYKYQKAGNIKIQSYTISIPKLKINNAVVSTTNINLQKNLVNYGGTAIPPDNGNTVIFGHSTLPQFFDEKNYKTIFSTLYRIGVGDAIIVNSDGVNYRYKVENIIVVDPDNTSVLEQNYDDSFLTLVTCTPPGTIWKRLVVKARLEKI